MYRICALFLFAVLVCGCDPRPEEATACDAGGVFSIQAYAAPVVQSYVVQPQVFAAEQYAAPRVQRQVVVQRQFARQRQKVVAVQQPVVARQKTVARSFRGPLFSRQVTRSVTFGF